MCIIDVMHAVMAIITNAIHTMHLGILTSVTDAGISLTASIQLAELAEESQMRASPS